MSHLFFKHCIAAFALCAALAIAPNATRAAEGDEPPGADLTPVFDRWNLEIKTQRQRDTCAVFTVAGALEFGLSKRLDDGVRLSEEYLNWAANDANGDWADGATFSQLQRGFAKWGVALGNQMPYRAGFNPAVAPSQTALASARQVWELKPKWHWIAREGAGPVTTAHIASIKRVLDRGWPVCGGGEHCLLLVAYSDNWQGGGTFLARDYAHQTYETLTYAEVQRRFRSLLWIEFAPLAKKNAASKSRD